VRRIPARAAANLALVQVRRVDLSKGHSLCPTLPSTLLLPCYSSCSALTLDAPRNSISARVYSRCDIAHAESAPAAYIRTTLHEQKAMLLTNLRVTRDSLLLRLSPQLSCNLTSAC